MMCMVNARSTYSSWNKNQDNIVVSRWIYLYILEYDARNHEPKNMFLLKKYLKKWRKNNLRSRYFPWCYRWAIISDFLTRRVAMHEFLTSKGKGKAIPLQAWKCRDGSRMLRLPDFETIGTWRWIGQPRVPAAFTFQDIFLVLSSVRGRVNPRAIVRPEGLCQWKVPMAPSRLDEIKHRSVARQSPLSSPSESHREQASTYFLFLVIAVWCLCE
jgi:hypothetical protein